MIHDILIATIGATIYAAGVYSGWKSCHAHIGEEVKRELTGFNQEVAKDIKTVHDRIDKIAGIPKTMEEDIKNTVVGTTY